MKGVIKVLIGIFNVAYKILAEYSKYVLIVIVGIVSADVFSRNFLGGSIMWGQEISLVLIVWMCFLSMAVGEEKDLHISIEMFYNRMPKIVQKVVYYINKTLIVGVGVFFVIYGIKLVKNTWISYMPASRLPAGLLYIMIPVGGGFMAYFALLDILGLKKYKNTTLHEDEVEFEEPLAALEHLTKED